MLEDYDLEATHEESAIHQFGWVLGIAVVEDPVVLVALISQEPGQFSSESVNHGEIQRTEVFVEGKVSKVVIHVEEERIFVILWWLGI